MKVESEHKGTIRFIKAYERKHDKLPSNNTIFYHITKDHLREDPKYYSKLKKARL